MLGPVMNISAVAFPAIHDSARREASLVNFLGAEIMTIEMDTSFISIAIVHLSIHRCIAWPLDSDNRGVERYRTYEMEGKRPGYVEKPCADQHGTRPVGAAPRLGFE
jgi:hypothetical protein